jgi:hypothetical protein
MTTPTDAQLDALWSKTCRNHKLTLTRDMVRAFARAAIAAAHPQQPARVPLTEAQIMAACSPLGWAQLSPMEVARAIEAAHGIVPVPTTDKEQR